MQRAPARLQSLDALRGVAALAVVVWHWQHFQLLGQARLIWPPQGGPAAPVGEPFFPVLRLFYEQGYVAVDFFFLISGFIFFWLYGQRLAARSLGLAEFARLRLSRLYPLHLATLVLVAVLQALFLARAGQFFVYPANDLRHFLLSLVFIQGSKAQAAFNGPTWSLSIEIVMYALFATLARGRMLGGAWGPLALFALGVVVYPLDWNLSRGLCGFFVGGLTYQAFARLIGGGRAGAWLAAIGLAGLIGWGLVLADIYGDGAVTRILAPHQGPGRVLLSFAVLYGLGPVTLLALALAEQRSGAEFRWLAWLGEISYSSYLLHFPLQLGFALLAVWGLVSLPAVRSAPAMLIYFALLIPLSLLVYRRVERPAQALLRRLGRAPSQPAGQSAD